MQDFAKLLLRLMVGGLMLFHGVAKVMNFEATVEKIGGMAEKAGLPSAVAYGVFVGELLAPALLIVGIGTRFAALVLAINMVVAVWLAHAHEIFTLGQGGAWKMELQAFYFFSSIAILLLGSGRFAFLPDGRTKVT